MLRTLGHYVGPMPLKAFPLKHREERRNYSLLYIELTRLMWRVIGETREGEGGIDGNLLLVGLSVVVGHAEGRPMSAHKIAHFVSIPRTTVLRKLDDLVARGIIAKRGSTYVMAKDPDRAHLQRLARLVASHCP